MRILSIGILSFLVWSVFSSWYYVCNVRELCTDEETTIENEALMETSPGTLPESAKDEEMSEKSGIAAPEAVLIHFPFDSDNFQKEDRIDKYISELGNYLKNSPGAALLITGYTDGKGSTSYNQDLGKRRAISVASFCELNGIPSEKIQTESRGESDPVASNDTPDGRAENRRVEFAIINKK